uniref:Uncharacterized protein n=1 Tax=Clastoptera arizonana TaxID=38151 RepID=A0A1B6CVK2_9HEMI
MICILNILSRNGYQAIERTSICDVKYLIKQHIKNRDLNVQNYIKSLSSFKSPSLIAEEKIRIEDKVPTNYNLIYKAPMLRYCQIAYVLAAFSTTVLPIWTYGNYFLLSAPELSNQMMKLNESLAIDGYNDLLSFTIGSLIFSWSIILFVFKYPYRIYYSPQTKDYIAVISSSTPFKTKNIHFKSALKVVPKILTFNFFYESLYQLGTTKYFLLENYFRKPIDLEIMLQSKPTCPNNYKK